MLPFTGLQFQPFFVPLLSVMWPWKYLLGHYDLNSNTAKHCGSENKNQNGYYYQAKGRLAFDSTIYTSLATCLIRNYDDLEVFFVNKPGRGRCWKEYFIKTVLIDTISKTLSYWAVLNEVT